MLRLQHYALTETIYTSSRSLVYRGTRKLDDMPVVIKVMRNEYPSQGELARFRLEYDILNQLEGIDGVINAYALEPYRHGYLMVMEDFGGQSFAKVIQRAPFELDAFLNTALQTVTVLDEVHQRNIIHKDITPANILYNPNTGQVKLIDFGIATILSQENPEIRNANILQGTLSYLSPEQTGRMNRPVDYRSDFYALGATFYTLLTGQPPFVGTDPLELVHAHIARQPISPLNLRPNLPYPVADIVLKLLAKTAEDRYQSGYGLRQDLETCIEAWQTQGRIESLPLAEFDYAERLQIPQKLYGREAEVESLLASFERVSAGASEVMMVTGDAGIGKSVLIKELYKPLSRQSQAGFFINGKFDQFQRNIPYSALVQAFKHLTRLLLTESETKLAEWRQKIKAALGPNGQVMVDLLPELELIIGKQPPVPELPATEAQNRFNVIIQNFVQVFAKREHPLIIFLDDLQWADLATLNFLKLFLSAKESEALLLIGAYRSHEVSPGHPLLIALDDLRKLEAPFHQIELSPFDLEAITALISDTLSVPPSEVESLAELVFQKTNGNPFFVNEFLKSMYAEELLRFSAEAQSWQWNLAEIRQVDITDNVVTLMGSKIKKLDPKTQQVLQLAACIGSPFNLETLSTVLEESNTETAQRLWDAMQEGLVLPLSDAYKLVGLLEDQALNPKQDVDLDFEEGDIAASESLDIDSQSSANSPTSQMLSETSLGQISYKFLHDRVQQAAYSLIPDDEKQSVHLRVGRVLLENTTSDTLDDELFGIVNQLNLGQALIDDPAEKIKLAEYNLQAGQKAIAAAAYGPALLYLQTGVSLLDENSWQTHYDLSRDLHTLATEAAYLSSELEQMHQHADLVMAHARDLLEKVKIYEILILYHTAQNEPLKAVTVARNVLALLDIHLPEQASLLDVAQGLIKTRVALGFKDTEALYNLPEMSDPKQLAAMRILMNTISAAYIADPQLFPVIVFNMVQLSVKYGNSALSPFGYATYAVILCAALGFVDAGYEMGEFSLRLMEKYQAYDLKAKLFVSFNVTIRHWKAPVRDMLPDLLLGYQSGMETGDLEYTCHNAMYYSNFIFLVGDNLTSVAEQQAQYLGVMEKFRQEFHVSYARIWYQLTLILQNPHAEHHQLIGDVFDETEQLDNLLENNNQTALFCLYLAKTILAYHLGQYVSAIEAARLAEPHEQAVLGSPKIPTHKFYQSLALLAFYPLQPPSEQKQTLRQVKGNQKKFKKWATQSPVNYKHKYLLVEAEFARLEGRDGEARELYDQAIHLASEAKYIQEAALANELAGKFYLEKQMPKLAQPYLRDAEYGYQRWGAAAKVSQLQQRYEVTLASSNNLTPNFSTSRSQTDSADTSSKDSVSAMIDLTSIIKASQVISGEIMLDRLLERLMRLVIENAGADRGHLLLEWQRASDVLEAKSSLSWVIQASGRVDQEAVSVMQARPLLENGQALLPISLVNYVSHTKEDVVLDNPAEESSFSDDPYIAEHQPQSVLCMSLLNQGKLIGIIYLENRLTTGAFTADRLDVLRLLSAQAAVSIENAQLYQERLLLSAIQRELSIAHDIQQSLLPPITPEWNEPQVVCYSAPARDVGGDFYIYHHHLETTTEFDLAVGDVTGKGIPAALLMSVSLASWRALVSQSLSPSDLLLQLSTMLFNYTEASRQNCAMVHMHLQDNTATFSNAGCVTPLLKRADGQIEWVDVGGIPLGIGVAAIYNEIEVTLAPGDMVILTSDGVVEAQNADKVLFGFERLEAAVKDGPSETVDQMLDHLQQSLTIFTGNVEQHDDITIMVVQV